MERNERGLFGRVEEGGGREQRCKGSVSGHKYVKADACEQFCLAHREASTYKESLSSVWVL